MQYGVKKYKTGEYYSVQAVSMFTTNQFILLCPKDIIRFYRESWKFDLLNVDFDTNTRKKLRRSSILRTNFCNICKTMGYASSGLETLKLEGRSCDCIR